jgi:hypothetical protein
MPRMTWRRLPLIARNPALARLMLCCRGQFGWQGAVPSIVASFVFAGIGAIAQSGDPLAERLARTAQRISQFEADLAASGRPAGMVEERRNQLRTMLEEAANNRNRPPDERAVFREALDYLAAAR